MTTDEDIIVPGDEESREEPAQERVFKFLTSLDCNPIRAVSPEGNMGSILQHEEGQQWNRTLLERMIDIGLLVDENGIPCDALAVPNEIVTLPDGRTGVMVDGNLAASRRGLFWMLDPSAAHMAYDDGVRTVFRCLADLACSIRVLAEDGNCFLKTWDGHQMFFNLDYGITTVVLDGVDLVETHAWDLEADPVKYTNDALASSLLYALTGAWPDREDAPAGVPESGEYLYFAEGASEPEGADEILARWDALPEQLREAFVRANTGEAGCVTAEQWVNLLGDDNAETAKCPCCGRHHPVGVRRCVFCGQQTSKRNLWVRFLVHNDREDTDFGVVFGRGVTLDGGNFTVRPVNSPMLKLLYNSTENMLGLRNLSPSSWQVYGPDGVRTVRTGGIAEICEDMKISLDPAETVWLEFRGYESPEKW